MKLLYTEMTQDMTAILAKEAQQFAQEGKRVFYIAPNSLSFEKERSVLSYLEQEASFDIIVTRFTQMARYFVLNAVNPKSQLDDTGLAMMFYKVLSRFSDTDLKVYGRLRKDSHFINQLVELYKELKTAHMTVLDLNYLDESEKQADLIKIFLAVNELLQEGNFDNQTQLAFFAQQIEAAYLDKVLAETVIVIDGFTRFSAEEDYLLNLLDAKCHQIIIGTYISQKAYRSNILYGNIYQASSDFLHTLANRFAVKPEFIAIEDRKENTFSRLTRLLESRHDFSQTDLVLTESDKQAVQIWDVINQKEEAAQTAKAIRQLLADGVRYKDILVLLGDVDSYQLQIGKIFDKFAIPYYFAKAESMSTHPLINFVESLERVKRYHYRAEDVMNLLKSGLYGNLSQKDIDHFEHYVTYADIKGRRKFTQDFTAANGQKYDLVQLNKWRAQLMEPLDQLLSLRPQKGHNLLKKLSHFLEAVRLPQNMALLTQGASDTELDKHEQVWKAFSHILEQLQLIFGEERLKIDEFLALLRSGMLAAEYRTVPATVDVVRVKSYDLVEPHSAKYVFALGMTQSHFPKITQNKSLISDEERSRINEAAGEQSRFDLVSKENVKKNHFMALSLFNAATKRLILSLPQLLNETEDDMSVYLKELLDLGVPLIDKGRNRFDARSDNIGNYKDLLSTVVAINRGDMDSQLDKESQTFWSVAVRYLRKRLEKEGVLIPHLLDDAVTREVSPEVMRIKFPDEELLPLSASALTAFYNNQYLYFLQYVLGLQQLESIHPDARQHGIYLHRVFERLMADNSSANFDTKLDQAIAKTNHEKNFALLYEENQESLLSRHILEDIARSTATVLRDNAAVTTENQEARFDLLFENTVKVTGIIDRVDRLRDGSIGVVDYKSGKTVFDIQKFYNGLSPQLVTYLEALRQDYQLDISQLFGAMYLHMQEPRIDLSKVAGLDKILTQAHSSLTYKGLFLETEKEHLAAGSYSLRDSVYDKAELETLLTHNLNLFTQAAKTIRSGAFLINPYTEDGESVQGEQLKAITHFEADRHMGQARKLVRLPKKGKKDAFLALMNDAGKEN
ncbi:ATP-dependent nuclease subunit B [Streptococcus dentiloxodontae]